jgi:MFS-type transporter involved in bile tolerance (Atg22 family)
MFLLTPILGAIADHSETKRRFLVVFATWGAMITSLLFLTTGDVLLTWSFSSSPISASSGPMCSTTPPSPI